MGCGSVFIKNKIKKNKKLKLIELGGGTAVNSRKGSGFVSPDYSESEGLYVTYCIKLMNYYAIVTQLPKRSDLTLSGATTVQVLIRD